ncbi:hypothetical protein M2390_002477 [Mycetocola sp. BIGb0189]|uniref:hypothetical protein n=1 Tax=Mycetocola sp. BIGb0189 TaxID=2940604 RepID=UPI002168D4CF|nr:hypothetical protein [Mycetocola sp. BIGb0189]MCS4277273.1 hypothetical protein [Mycetocola sp. BIGb0189]
MSTALPRLRLLLTPLFAFALTVALALGGNIASAQALPTTAATPTQVRALADEPSTTDPNLQIRLKAGHTPRLTCDAQLIMWQRRWECYITDLVWADNNSPSVVTTDWYAGDTLLTGISGVYSLPVHSPYGGKTISVRVRPGLQLGGNNKIYWSDGFTLTANEPLPAPEVELSLARLTPDPAAAGRSIRVQATAGDSIFGFLNYQPVVESQATGTNLPPQTVDWTWRAGAEIVHTQTTSFPKGWATPPRFDIPPQITETSFTPTQAQIDAGITVHARIQIPGFRDGNQSTVISVKKVRVGTVQVSGTARVGETLTAIISGWEPDVRLTYGWSKQPGGVITGATGPTLALTEAEAGTTITATVTGSREGQLASSATSQGLAIPRLPEPVSAFTARIEGDPRVGNPLTAIVQHPNYPTARGLSFVWMRDGNVIPGAEAETYTPVADDLGHTFSVRLIPASAHTVGTEITSPETTPVGLGIHPDWTRVDYTGNAGFEPTVELLPSAVSGATYTVEWIGKGRSPDGSNLARKLHVTEVPTILTANVTIHAPGYPDKLISLSIRVEKYNFKSINPRIDGNLRVGSVLTVTSGAVSSFPVSGASTSVIWYGKMPGGQPQRLGTQGALTLTSEHRGMEISADVTASAYQHLPISGQAPSNGRVVTEVAKIDAVIPSEVRAGTLLQATVDTNLPADSLTFRWERDGKVLTEETAQTLTVSPGWVGSALTVTVASNAPNFTGITTATSSPSRVLPAEFTEPRIETTGTPTVAKQVEATATGWGTTPDTETPTWFLDDTEIPGATDPQLDLTPAMAGKRLSVSFSATKLGFDPLTSARHDLGIIGPALLVPGTVTITVDGEPVGTSVRAGNILHATSTAWVPETAAYEWSWIDDFGTVLGHGDTLLLGPEHVGKRVNAIARGEAEGYAATDPVARSVPTPPVAPAPYVDAALHVTTSRPTPGTPLLISGTGFEPGEHVTLSLRSLAPAAARALGAVPPAADETIVEVTPNDRGAFEASIELPHSFPVGTAVVTSDPGAVSLTFTVFAPTMPDPGGETGPTPSPSPTPTDPGTPTGPGTPSSPGTPTGPGTPAPSGSPTPVASSTPGAPSTPESPSPALPRGDSRETLAHTGRDQSASLSLAWGALLILIGGTALIRRATRSRTSR